MFRIKKTSRKKITSICRINLKDLSKEIDVRELASMIISKTPVLSEANRTELEQVLFYLKKRKGINERDGSASSTATTSTIAASLDEVDVRETERR